MRSQQMAISDLKCSTREEMLLGWFNALLWRKRSNGMRMKTIDSASLFLIYRRKSDGFAISGQLNNSTESRIKRLHTTNFIIENLDWIALSIAVLDF